MHHWSRSSCH